jgi:ADP-heptose:LPS heptosyltransferase/glycosyltransferase involved in cell wall biosynthesis
MPMTHRPVRNTPYCEDETELWTQPTPIPCPKVRPATPEEIRADNALATVLNAKYVSRHAKADQKMYDMVGETTSLKDKFRAMGYEVSDIAKPGLDLMTAIHTFQHLDYKEAIEFLKSAARNLKPQSGYLFIRMPDRDVPGYERDLQKGFPCFWNLTSFLAALDQVKTLRIVETYTINPGQRDYFLQVFDREPTICAGMIVKNEERDLPKGLKTLEGVIDGLVVMDTGSTDRTIQVVREKAPCSYFVDTYLGASEQDEKGDWKLWDFGKARNAFLDKIDTWDLTDRPADWVLWMDADDILLDPRKLRNLKYLWSHDVQGIQMNAGDTKWTHHRLWKNRKGIRFHGRCHEYPAFGTMPTIVHDNVRIFHDATAGAGENANARNLRILTREFEEAPTPRNAFYLANTHKDGGRYAEAVKYYDARMKFGKGYEDEYWFAALYKARCQAASGDPAGAQKTLLWAVSEKPDWAEFWMELSYLENGARQSKKSLAYSLLAQDLPIVPTNLFREKNKYEDQPYRMGSFGAEAIGEKDLALKFALKAKEFIGPGDRDWEDRIKRLSSNSKEKWICWHRPGAIGDILMTLNLIAPFKAENPDVKIRYACNPNISKHLASIMLGAGIDEIISSTEKIPDGAINLIGYPIHEGYPEKPMRKHLLEYFADELGIKEQTKIFDSFSLPDPERQIAGAYCTVHVQAGWSPYKNWQIERWEEICAIVSRHLKVIQIGGPDDPVLRNAQQTVMGGAFERNLNLFAHSKFHMGIDSWSNHATNIRWAGKGKTKGLILWGSTQVSGAGYNHNRNISLGLACQPCFREDPKISRMPRGPCPHLDFTTMQHACMAGISVDRVATELVELLAPE